jgi:hypothetical protein
MGLASSPQLDAVLLIPLADDGFPTDRPADLIQVETGHSRPIELPQDLSGVIDWKSSDSTLTAIDLNGQVVRYSLVGEQFGPGRVALDGPQGIRNADISASGNVAVIVDGQLRVYAENREQHRLSLEGLEPVQGVKLSPSSKRIAVTSSTGPPYHPGDPPSLQTVLIEEGQVVTRLDGGSVAWLDDDNLFLLVGAYGSGRQLVHHSFLSNKASVLLSTTLAQMESLAVDPFRQRLYLIGKIDSEAKEASLNVLNLDGTLQRTVPLPAWTGLPRRALGP